MNALGLSDTHARHLSALRRMPATVDAEGLRIGDQYVMFFAEAELMREHADRLTYGVPHADVLEVGLGLGVFAGELVNREIGSYTAIEPLPEVAALIGRRVLDTLPAPATVYVDPWQLVPLREDTFDAIMYDTWPPDGHADADFADFVARVAVPSLRPGGRFSFFHSGDQLSPARRAVLDRHFATWTAHPYTMPAADVPPSWTKPTREFLIPIATKEGAT